jgi:hypothetical protein
MSGASERDELHSLISGVRRCIAALQSQDGDRAPMRRIVNAADRLLNDIDRLDIDTDELDSGRAAPQLHAGEKIPLPDTHYDTDFWRGVDDEGLGGQFGSQ